MTIVVLTSMTKYWWVLCIVSPKQIIGRHVPRLPGLGTYERVISDYNDLTEVMNLFTE